MLFWANVMRQIQPWSSSLRAEFQNLLRVPAPLTPSAPHVRSDGSVQAYWNAFVIASLPAWLAGLWSIGHQANLAIAQLQLRELPGWRATILEHAGIGFEAGNVFACFVHGLLWFLPVFITALIAGAVCQALFARIRQRPPDDGLLYIAWFFSLLMPATVPLYQVVLGMAFGVIMGKLIFGGSGRYLFNPALLGAAFLVFSYPGLVFGEGAWVPVPGYDQPTILELLIDEGGFGVVTALDYHWLQLFLGNQPGSFGTTSVLAILLGAVWLTFIGVASWRVILGSFAGLTCTVLLFNFLGAENPLFEIPWYWHAVLGGFAFASVFIATDPVAGALTSSGRWGYGILVGVFTVIIRLANPSYYEGVMFAILLASTFSPLIDHAVVARHVHLRKLREKS
jgi:Na+-transporting NADH:ubiquinone oxidoreductase subunit B